MRIAVGGFLHESHSFAPRGTAFADFVSPGGYPGLVAGERLFEAMQGAACGLRGAIEAAAGHELVPLMWCFASPAGPVADEAASAVARHQAGRAAMLAFQRHFPGTVGAVVDGRDIGTVVFPEATVKLFVTADPGTRARRRWEELDRSVPLAEIEAEMQARDLRDSNRAVAPLTQAQDAVLIDTTTLDADAALAAALGAVQARLPAGWEP